MNIKQNLVTPRNGEPIIAATQDFITGCYLLTRRDTFYDRSEFTQICAYLHDGDLQIDLPHPTIIKPVRLWTGKQIFNVLMRPNKDSKILINLECKNKTFDKLVVLPDDPNQSHPPDMTPNDGYLVIQNSEIMCGLMDKSSVGDGNKKSVFAVIQRDYGPDEAASAMNKMAKLCARWLGMSSRFPRHIAKLTNVRRSEQGIFDRYQRCHAWSGSPREEGRPHRESVRRFGGVDRAISFRKARESAGKQFRRDSRIDHLGSPLQGPSGGRRDLYAGVEPK